MRTRRAVSTTLTAVLDQPITAVMIALKMPTIKTISNADAREADSHSIFITQSLLNSIIANLQTHFKSLSLSIYL